MSASTHFIGIGGSGLSAIARVLIERDEIVTGSDREETPLTESLSEDGARITIGHKAENVNGAFRVIRSSAVRDDNVEVQAALSKGIPVLKRSEMLADLLQEKELIAIAGSHGKTTTTAMIAWILTTLKESPGYIIGSVAENLGKNAAAGKGKNFVIEADEYDYMFLGLSPNIALVTNVEHDHPDIFPNASDFESAFASFVEGIVPGGILLLCADDPGAMRLEKIAENNGINSYSYSLENSKADYFAANLMQNKGSGYSFTFQHIGSESAKAVLNVPGLHNAQNALGALSVIELMGLPIQEAADALMEFKGTSRRFEILGEFDGVILVDDYAHHPTEIKASLSAARSRYPEWRIVAVWQPHTYSRTQLLWDDFATSFIDADKVLLTSVFAARENKPDNFDMKEMTESIEHPDLSFSQSIENTTDLLEKELQAGDLLIVLSAGDAIQINARLKASLGGRK